MSDVSEAFHDVAQAIVSLKQEHVRAIGRVRSRMTWYAVLTFLALIIGIAAIAMSGPQLLALVDPTETADDGTAVNEQITRMDGRVESIDARLTKIESSIAEILKANQMSAEGLDELRRIVSQPGEIRSSQQPSDDAGDTPVSSVTTSGAGSGGLRLPPERPQ